MIIDNTKVFRETWRAMARSPHLIANKGGTRSGKTYATLKLLFFWGLYGKPRAFDIVSESVPHLKRGALKDFEEITNEFKGIGIEENRSDRVFTLPNGATFQFFSADNWGKVKGSRRDVLFVNEANRIDWETFRQLSIRTTKMILIDFNPDCEFWYDTQGLSARPDTVEIKSTYKDNPFLTPQQVAEIESNKNDTHWWRIYGLGETGMSEGIIFKEWQQVGEIPKNAKLIGRGVDFGFTNDPTAIVAVYMSGGELYVDEECYSHGLTNDKIAERLKGKQGRIVADSAEQKSIAEIRTYGVRNIEGAIKGTDSIKHGIQILQRYKINVTATSLNLINELRNYHWLEDRITGELKNQPVDKFNHAIDAMRYVALNCLTHRSTGGARATLIRV